MNLAGDLIESIRSLLPSDCIAASERLEEYAVDGLTPQIVVSPNTADEVAAVLHAAARHGAAVIPWGGGTGITTGNPPSRYDVALDVTRLNQVVAHEPADLTAVVQGGIRLQEMQDHLAQKGQYLPFDPPLPRSATIGGILAANAGGPWRYAYGWPRDWVLGLKVALADGHVTKAGGRVVKNVAGYDMSKLYIGSFGTLGVVVEAAFKVTPLPEACATAVALFDSCGAAVEAGLAVHKRNLSLEAIEVVSPEFLTAAGIEHRGWALIIAAVGNAAAVERSLTEVGERCRDLQCLPDDRAAALWEQVRNLSLPPQDGLLARAALLPSQVGGFMEGLPQVAQEQHLTVQAVSHLGLGTVYGLWQGPGEGEILERGPSLVSALRGLAARHGGTVVIEGCPTALKRQIDVWSEPRGDSALMRRIKEELDPQGTLSPGRFLGRL